MSETERSEIKEATEGKRYDYFEAVDKDRTNVD
jgi:hypothetical protein